MKDLDDDDEDHEIGREDPQGYSQAIDDDDGEESSTSS